MSFYRAKTRAENKNVYDANRLAVFNKPPIKKGDLYVEHNEIVGGDLTIGGDLRAKNYYASGNYYLNNYILIPYGTIIQSAAVNIPDGWLSCDGTAYLKTAYQNLYNAIGNTYGTWSNTDLSFNVPDIRGRVIIGENHNSTYVDSSYNFATTGGEEKHTLTIDEMPAHNHTSISDTGLISKSTGGSNTPTGVDSNNPGGELNITSITTLDSNGGGQSHNNMQPYIVLRYLIKY